MSVTVALGIMAALKYSLGDMILADAPEKGPVQAAKESKTRMQGKRGMLFSLYLSFVLWYLLETLVTSVVMDMFGSIPGLMTEMLCSLAITVYLHASVSAFYLTTLAEKPGNEEPGTGENPA